VARAGRCIPSANADPIHAPGTVSLIADTLAHAVNHFGGRAVDGSFSMPLKAHVIKRFISATCRSRPLKEDGGPGALISLSVQAVPDFLVSGGREHRIGLGDRHTECHAVGLQWIVDLRNRDWMPGEYRTQAGVRRPPQEFGMKGHKHLLLGF
jgi:hypothetical protein